MVWWIIGGVVAAILLVLLGIAIGLNMAAKVALGIMGLDTSSKKKKNGTK